MIAFPTPVGMNRTAKRRPAHKRGVPHTRGDEPAGEDYIGSITERSPHPWG